MGGMAFDGSGTGRGREASAVALRELAASTRAGLAAVRDDPERRYRRREEFYACHGSGWGGPGYGAAELAFMRWEIRRGLLNAEDHRERPGSAYWRAINEELAFASEMGAATLAARLPASGEVSAAWIDYLRRPSARAWYRAHNIALVRAMLDHAGEAAAEPPEERLFINEALYRVIYVEAAVSGAALGRAGPVLVDPRLFAVDAVLRVAPLYPLRYPVPEPPLLAVRRAVARAFDRAGQRLVHAPGAFRALLLARLRPLVAGRLDDAEIVRRVAAGEPLYPDVARRSPAPRAPRPALDRDHATEDSAPWTPRASDAI